MAEFRYPHFCPISRAAELLGERWTLLILRELFPGPQRFSDLRRHLGELSPSVLSQRLQRLEQRGLVRQEVLPPPAAVRVYALDEAGRALRPAFLELARWGMRFLEPPGPGDRIEARWLRMGLEAFLEAGATPACSIEIRMPDETTELVFRVLGGAAGARIEDGPGAADAVLRTTPLPLLALLQGQLPLRDALSSGALACEGDRSQLERLPRQFAAPQLPLTP